MSAPAIHIIGDSELEEVIATSQLAERPARRADHAAETQILLKLQRDLAYQPRAFFQKLVDAALQLSHAGSTGISLLNESQQRFVWPAVAGGLRVYLGQGTPRDFGPCGTVLDRDMTLVMQHPERHFAYLVPIQPPLEEVLLVPFYTQGKAVGTLWAVSHDPARKFDAEDRRLLESLCAFAASAYETLAKAGALEPLLRVAPPAPAAVA